MHARNGSGICWASHLYRFHCRHNHHCLILSYYQHRRCSQNRCTQIFPSQSQPIHLQSRKKAWQPKYMKLAKHVKVVTLQCTMRFRQWRFGIRVFGTLALILWVLRPFQAKMSLSLSNSLCFAWISLVKLGKNCKNSYFSDFEPIFLLFGGVCSKKDFSKKKFFLREGFFETNLDLNIHSQQVFLFFWAFFLIFFLQKKYSSYS